MSIFTEDSKKAIEAYGADTVKFAKINIGAKRRYKRSSGRTTSGRIDSTGTLRNSLQYKLKESKNSFVLTVGATGSAAKYADVVESGRRKGKYIPIADLTQWIKKKRIKIKNKDGRFVKQTESAIYWMAKSISKNAKENGIPAKNYLKDASEQAFAKHKANITEALFRDVEQATGHIIRQLEKTGLNSR